MAILREILVEWTTVNGAGHFSVFNFESGISVATQRQALETMLDAFAPHLDNSCFYGIRTDGREFEDSTGTLTGAWSDNVGRGGGGSGAGEPVADATQVLLQWKCAAIINGRFLKGRTFIPGLASSNEIGGNLSGATNAAFTAAANTFIASGAGLTVWHRPVSGTGGSHDAVSTMSVWPELAVLRRRRR